MRQEVVKIVREKKRKTPVNQPWLVRKVCPRRQFRVKSCFSFSRTEQSYSAKFLAVLC